MAGSGIWLDDQTYAQTAGQIWAQGAHQQLQAGEDWAQQAIANSLKQLQAMVPQVSTAPPPAPTPTPAPVATPPPAPPTPAPEPPPTPAPIPVAQTPVAESPPPSAPAPALPPPLPETPATPAAPIPGASQGSDMLQAGQNWAQQQINTLLNPAQQTPQTSSATADLTGATSPANAPAGLPSATSSTPVPSGPQPASPGDFIDQARQAAQAAGIDPEIFSRQIQQESGFNPNAKSGAGALGIAQFMPETARGMGIDPLDAAQSLKAAAQLDAQNLSKYGGDWSKALAAYNAGGGNVDRYGGIPPFEETQRYVQNILGGAKDVVQSAVQRGETAVNNAVQGVQSAVARVSQFGMGLSSGDAMAFCGPAAALAFAQTYGRNPTIDEAKQLAQQVGWNPDQGMAGPSSEVALLKNMGIDAHMTSGVDWKTVGQDASSGNPVIIDTPGHYYYIDGYNADSGKFHVGTSGTDLKGGSEWMSADQINAMPQSGGSARAAIYADHPLSGPGQAATMGTNQPALAQFGAGSTLLGQPSGPAQPTEPLAQFGGGSQLVTSTPLLGGAQDLSGSLLQQGQRLVSNLLSPASPAIQNQASTIADAVLNVGGKAQQTGQDVLTQAQSLLGQGAANIAQAPQSIGDMLSQNALVSQGIPTIQGALTGGLQTAFGTPEQPSGLSQQLLGGGPAGLLTAGERALGQGATNLLGGLANVPVLGGLRGPELLSDQEILDQAGPRGVQAMRDMLAPLNAAVGQPLTDDQVAAGLRNQMESQAVAMASTGAPSIGDWIKGAYRGGVIGGLNTMADVGANATITPLLSYLGGISRDMLSLNPARAVGRTSGALQGMADWTNNFLAGLSATRPGSLRAQAGGGVPGVLANLFEGAGALHGAFQNATAELIQSMEQGAGATAQAAQAAGERAAARGDLGTLTSGLGAGVTKLGPIGDALFPVYRMGMALASRMVESSPLGLAGTGFDVLRGTTPLGRLVGEGPYAGGAFNAPTRGGAPTNVVGPLSERLTNNVLGTALSVWLANQAVQGNVTGSGPTDPAQRQVWLANGNQPNSFRSPVDGKFYSWDKLAPQLRGPLMAAGAYADAAQAYTAAQGRQANAGPQAYGVADPREAAAWQLVSEVGHQLMSATPLRTFANLYDALAGGGGGTANAGLGQLSDIASGIVGGAVPLSGTVRSIAQMTDPTQRLTLSPEIASQLPQSVLENVEQNIPGLRQTLPARVDVLGRDVANPQQGLGQILPARAAAGQASPVLQAMQVAGVAPSAAPPAINYGPYGEIRLTPQERQTWEQLRGRILQQSGANMVSSPGFQQSSPKSQQMSLNLLDQLASNAANLQMLSLLAPSAAGRQQARAGALTVPVVGYSPDVLNNQAMLQQQIQSNAQHRALIQSLLGSQA